MPLRNKARGDRYAKLCTYTQGQVYRRVVYLDGWVFACFGPGDPGWERYWIAWQDAIKGLSKGLYRLANPLACGPETYARSGAFYQPEGP